MRSRVLKRQNNSYLELPQEMAGQDEVELFQLKPGYYLLTIPLGDAKATAVETKTGISEAERAVLLKLLSIKFEKRVPAYVSKVMSEGEMTVLKELERKGMINVFKGTKYKDGVYNIRDSIYPLLSSAPRAQPTRTPAQQVQTPNDLLAILKRQGFIVLGDRNEARALSETLSQDMKSGAATGVKGFDGRFYIVTKSYLIGAQTAIAAALKEDMDAPSIAAAAKLDPEGCMAVLRLMAEAGDLIEKKKGVFAPV
jgi:hypothetical protein